VFQAFVQRNNPERDRTQEMGLRLSIGQRRCHPQGMAWGWTPIRGAARASS
jgi:hypothetical protein